ncbi:MAG: hypothetical protein HZA54_09420 [Planctomycetes bacterium]|nr:hypothetical protein [Planctomycetota bacterium]
MKRPAEMLLGRLAVERGWVSRAQVEAALRAQEGRRPVPPLGVLLVEQGALRQDQVNTLLETQVRAFARLDLRRGEDARGWLFGYLAVERGFARREQVNAALREQGRASEAGRPIPPLGRLLEEQGALNERQVAELLRLQEESPRAGAAEAEAGA